MSSKPVWTTAVAVMMLAGCGSQQTPPAQSSTAAGKEKAAAAPPEKAPAEAPKPRPITVPAGAALKVRLNTTLSTKTVKTGETFTATLAEPLRVGGDVIAAKGTQVTGRVVESDPGGRVSGRARIAVQLTGLEAGGRTLGIVTGTVARRARATKKKDALKVGIGAGVGAAIGAIAGGGKGAAIGSAAGAGAGTGAVLATRGDPAVIPAESLLTFRLTAPAVVNAP